MNQYPAWKYALILVILLVGGLYALPNLFGEDPAVQITSSRGFPIPQELEAAVEDALLGDDITFKNSERAGNRLLYRFDSNEEQLAAAATLRKGLGGIDSPFSWKHEVLGILF